MAGLYLTGCGQQPNREEFQSRELKCLQCYYGSNAITAEAALIDCARDADRCQSAGVEGIQYNEVFARIYGRLYLVERHLGHSKAAEQDLERYAHYHALLSSFARQSGCPYGEMERLIEHKFDNGIQPAWKTQ